MPPVTRCPGIPSSPGGQTAFQSVLHVERFDYVRLGEQISLVRLRSWISDERPLPAGARLRITRGEEQTEHVARGCSLDSSAPPDPKRATGLLWRASFVVPLEIVENPRSLFELSDLTGAVLILPRPEPHVNVLLDTAELRAGRVGSWQVLRRLVALATVLTVTAAYSPGLGLAVTTGDSWVRPHPHAMTGARTGRKSEGAGRRPKRRADSSGRHQTKRVKHTGAGQRGSGRRSGAARPGAKPHTTTTTPTPTTPTTTSAPTATTPTTTTAPTATTPTTTTTTAPTATTPTATTPPTPTTGWAHQPSLWIPGAPSPTHLPGATHQTTTHHGGTHHGVTSHGKHGGGRPGLHRHPNPERKPSKLTQSPPQALASPPAQTDSGASIPSELSPFVKAGLAAELKLLSRTLQTGDQPPVFLIHIYKAAAHTYHLPWKILAAINAIETNYGRNLSVSSAGAIGWMQFMPGTWRRYGITPSGHGKPNPFDPRDAIFSAARYLAANGARHDLPRSLLAYNHANWYVAEVLLKARTINNGGGTIKHPRGAPATVAKVIEAGNSIATDPYIWGGGHASFLASGYDCSGSISYALAAAGLLKAPMVSGQFESWGKPGPGKWITIYASANHVWMTIAGWRFDTVALGQTGTRWAPSGGELSGYVVRHPAGL